MREEAEDTETVVQRHQDDAFARERFPFVGRVYGSAEHPHTAQQPEVLDVAALNRKNVRA